MDGWKETELAEKLGRTPSWVSERLSELRTEIRFQNGILPPLTDAEYGALKDSIRRQGVLLPVLVDETIDVIDGRHRLRITDELQLPCPFWVLYDLTPEEKREIAVILTASRRQLNRQQRRKLVECELMHDGTRSDRRIAAICGVSHTTVATVRADITQSVTRWRDLELPIGDAPAAPIALDDVVEVATSPVWQRRAELISTLPPSTEPLDQYKALAVPVAEPERRTDTLGRKQPVQRTRSTPPPKPPRHLADLACPNCDTPLRLTIDNGIYRLEHP